MYSAILLNGSVRKKYGKFKFTVYIQYMHIYIHIYIYIKLGDVEDIDNRMAKATASFLALRILNKKEE